MPLRRRLLVGALLIASACARPEFATVIPNGRAVPGVNALGHKNTEGGGALNAFGMAFENAGFKWTTELCRADSDGDGRSNGEELGDPCCVWKNTYGNEPTFSKGITHPGDASKTVSETTLQQFVCGVPSNSSDFSGGANPDPSGALFNETDASDVDEEPIPTTPPPTSAPNASPPSATPLAVHSLLLLSVVLAMVC